jgi:hypothetical protein
MLRAADEAHIVNTSSMNGFWASVGPDTPHTAYSAAKFAVKGFTEALIADFRMNAPHIRVSVVMPGHIGTGIRDNSLKVQTHTDADGLNAAQIAQIRTRLTSMGRDASKYSDADIERMHVERARRFVTDAPTSAAEAAKIILDDVRADSASWSGPTRTSSTAWCATTRTMPMNRSSTNVSPPKRAGTPATDGGARIGIVGGRPLVPLAASTIRRGNDHPGRETEAPGGGGIRLLPERDVEPDHCWNHPGQLLTEPERSYGVARSPGLRAGRRAGSKGARSIVFAAPSRISSAIASAVAGAFRMPQTLWPVAT